MSTFTHRLGGSLVKRTPSLRVLFRVAWFGAMSSGNAPKSAAVGCAGKDGTASAGHKTASAGRKKRASDLWNMLYVAKPMQNAAGGQPPSSFFSKEVAEPQPALDHGEDSDHDSIFSDDASDRKDLQQECKEMASRLANQQQVWCHRCLP